jgi:hypothetical protein
MVRWKHTGVAIRTIRRSFCGALLAMIFRLRLLIPRRSGDQHETNSSCGDGSFCVPDGHWLFFVLRADRHARATSDNRRAGACCGRARPSRGCSRPVSRLRFRD